jgi:TIR domain
VPRKAKCKVFVSYSRHDEEVVRPLAGLLAGVTAKPIFLDIESIKPGDLWESDIEDAVRSSEVFVLCWCCQSEQSKFVKREIRLAVAVMGKRLIPVLFCSVPLPRALEDRQWVDLSGGISHTCRRDRHWPFGSGGIEEKDDDAVEAERYRGGPRNRQALRSHCSGPLV